MTNIENCALLSKYMRAPRKPVIPSAIEKLGLSPGSRGLDAACSQPTTKTVDEPGDVGRFTSLALTKDDFSVISYYNWDKEDLKVTVCDDIACSTPALVTVDQSGQVGRYGSLALTSNGYPRISYFDGSPDNNLKLSLFEPPPIHINDVYLPTIFVE